MSDIFTHSIDTNHVEDCVLLDRSDKDRLDWLSRNFSGIAMTLDEMVGEFGYDVRDAVDHLIDNNGQWDEEWDEDEEETCLLCGDYNDGMCCSCVYYDEEDGDGVTL